MNVLGFDGQVNSKQVSRIIANTMTPIGYVLGPDDLRVTAVQGRRAVRVAGGAMQSGFIFAQEPGATQLPDFSLPSGGREWLIAVEFNSASGGTARIVALGGAGGPIQTAPLSLPDYSGVGDFRGGLADVEAGFWHVPLAWAWIRNQDNAVQLFDVRTLRGGMPAVFGGSRGIMRLDRPGSGYDAWAKQPVLGFLWNNYPNDPALARANDMPAGVYDIDVTFSLGATVEGLGFLRVRTEGAIVENLSKDIRVDLGAHRIVKWGRPHIHPGGVLKVIAEAGVTRADGGTIFGSIQNGTGFVSVTYRGRVGE